MHLRISRRIHHGSLPHNLRVNMEILHRLSSLTVGKLCQTPVSDSGDLNLLEQCISLLQVKDITVIDFSQRFEAQQSLPNKIISVEVYRRSSYHFLISVT